MTVKELMAFLATQNPEALVVTPSFEGNGYYDPPTPEVDRVIEYPMEYSGYYHTREWALKSTRECEAKRCKKSGMATCTKCIMERPILDVVVL